MANPKTNASQGNAQAKRRIRIWLLIVVLFMAWAAHTLIDQFNKHSATVQKLEQMQEQLNLTLKQSQELQLQVERLNDPEYIAQLATKEHGLVHDGEIPIHSVK